LEAVRNNGDSLEFASDELNNDKNIVLEAVMENGFSLEFASDELKNDKNIVLEAVKRDGRSLEYASDELKNDKSIVLQSVKSSTFGVKYASVEILNNFDVIYSAIDSIYSSTDNILNFVSDNLQNNNELILKVLTKLPYGKEFKWEFSDNIYLKNDDYNMKIRYFKCFAGSIGFNYLKFRRYDIELIFSK
jgi:hypothetical protein